VWMSTPLPSMDEVVKIRWVNVHSVIYSSQAKSIQFRPSKMEQLD